MYKTPSEHQISIFDFNRSCGTPLDEKNEWIRLADAIDWASLEKAYKNVVRVGGKRPLQSRIKRAIFSRIKRANRM